MKTYSEIREYQRNYYSTHKEQFKYYRNKNREYRLNWHKEYNNKNSIQLCQQAKINNTNRRSILLPNFTEFLLNHPCQCGEDNIIVLDCHHINQCEKQYEISTMIRQGRNWEDIQLELDKCIVLCANCHILLHKSQLSQSNKTIYLYKHSGGVKAVNEVLENAICVDCGYNNINALEFDHRDPTTKLFCIRNGFGHGYEKTIQEINKCDIVCRNCHKKRTAKQQNSWRFQFANEIKNDS